MATVVLHDGKASWDLRQLVDLLTELGHQVRTESWPLYGEKATFHRIEGDEPVKPREEVQA